MNVIGDVEEAVRHIRSRASGAPRLAVVLGSGLGAFADTLAQAVRVPYASIPHMKAPTVAGHAGELVLGTSGDVPVAVFSGRVHLYEGCSPAEVVFPVRVAAGLGAPVLALTSAAGSINANYRPGQLMLVEDHVNLTGANPLAGAHDPGLGERFVDMTEAYDLQLIALAEAVAGKAAIAVRKGVYVGFAGPSYETPAEVRMAQNLGGDAVGMSTVLEVIAARQLRLRVLGVSCLTNLAAGISSARETTPKLQHAGVLQAAHRADSALATLLTGVAQALPVDAAAR